MKQKLLKTMLLLCALVVGGASSVWAATAGFTLKSTSTVPIAANASPASTTITGSQSETWSVVINGTFTSSSMQGSNGAKYWQMGKSNSSITSAVFSTSGISGTITSIVVNCASAGGAGGSLSATVGGADFGTQNQTIPAWSSNTGGDVTFSGSASGTIVITEVPTSTKACYIQSITVTYTSGGGSTPSISLSGNTFNHTKDNVDDGAITVTYNNIASVNPEIVYYEADGETEVEDSEYDWLYADFDASNNIEYLLDDNTGSPHKAYMKIHEKNENVYSELITVTQASGIDQPSFSTAAGSVTAGTSITLSHASATSIIYTLDKSEPTKTNGTAYSTPITITVPTTIKAIAIVGEEVSDVATAAYTINVAAPEYNLASSGNYLAGTGVTLTSAGNTIYYNMTTDGSTPENPTSSSTEYTDPISLSSGTVKFKAIAYDSYGNASSVASRTVNGISPATLPFNWAGGGKSALTALTGVIGYGLPSDYAAAHNPYLVKFDGDGDYIEIFTNAQPLKVSVGVKMAGGGSTSKIKVQESTNGVEFSDVEELTISGSSNDILSLTTTKDFTSTTRVIKLLFVKGDNVGVGPISIVGGTLPATLNSSGYGTYASSFALDFSDDSEYSAWKITAANSSTGVITFSQITGTVAAGTGVLLKGTASSSINIPVAASGSDISATNLLEGITTAKTVDDDEYYGLKGDTFKKVNAGTVPAGKALLPASELGSVKSFTFIFEGATGVRTVEKVNAEEAEAIFNLAGQRLQKPQRGINIINGRKVVVK